MSENESYCSKIFSISDIEFQIMWHCGSLVPCLHVKLVRSLIVRPRIHGSDIVS